MNLHLNQVGLAGALFSLLCCLGFGPLIALLSAAGSGFLINDAVLAPLLVGFLVLGGIGLGITYRRHHRIVPMFVHIISAVILFVFTFIHFVSPLAWLAVAGLVAASVFDFISGNKACPQPQKTQNQETLP
jgi:MerC mercury resistance protein